jgi:hypothetical protein
VLLLLLQTQRVIMRNDVNAFALCTGNCVVKKKVMSRGGAFQHCSRTGLLYSDPEGVPSFISRGAAHQMVCTASASEGRNYVEGI